MQPTCPAPQPLEVTSKGSRVPAVVWRPVGEVSGVVLALHGGSGHKTSPAILAIASICLGQGLAVLAIDGPVHGDRSPDGGLDPVQAKTRFREAWRAGTGRLTVAEDMTAALDSLQAEPSLASLPVGYVGVSMGTAFGIPFLATDKRIQVAAIGLWSTTYPASEHLTGYARQISCPLWFTQQWDDEAFDRAATQDLFDAIGSADKRLVAYPGGHRELEGERLQDAIRFVSSRLKSS